jgi:hypothetical protein
VVAHGTGGAVAVVGHGFHDHRHAAGAVAFVGNGLVVVAARACRLFQAALDVVVGHVGGLGLGDDGGQAGVIGGVRTAALLHRDDQLLGDLGEGCRALGVLRALGFLDVMPFGMSGHGTLLSFYVILDDLPVGGGFGDGEAREPAAQVLCQHGAHRILCGEVARVDQADVVVDIVCHGAVSLDANHVAGLVLRRVVDQFNELLGLAGALHAHNQSDHSNHSCQLKSLGEIRYVKHTTRSREKQWRNEDSNFVHNGD